jgi:hypothetical protein
METAYLRGIQFTGFADFLRECWRRRGLGGAPGDPLEGAPGWREITGSPTAPYDVLLLGWPSPSAPELGPSPDRLALLLPVGDVLGEMLVLNNSGHAAHWPMEGHVVVRAWRFSV